MLAQSVPLLNVAKNYQKTFFRRDAVAGLTVAAIAIPQSIAYAQLVGVPPSVALYAAMFAMIVYAIFTSTRHVILGPDALVAALVGTTVLPLAGGDVGRSISLASLLAVFIGTLCLVGYRAKIAFIAEFLSRPILVGYIAGLALVVLSGQLPRLFGLTYSGSGNFFSSFWYILNNTASISAATLILSVALLIIMVLSRRYLPKLPISIFILVASIAVSAMFDFAGSGIATLGSISIGLPVIKLQAVSLFELRELITPAIIIMLVSFANTVAIGRADAIANSKDVSASGEFKALGLANIAVGLFGGMPVAGSGVRTAVNIDAKPKTQMSQLIGGLLVGIMFLMLAPFLQYLPQAALSVILVVAVARLFNYRELMLLWQSWRSEAILAVLTVLSVTFLGIIPGLIVAIILAMLDLVRKSTFPNDASLGITADGKTFRDKGRPPKTYDAPGLIIYRLDAPLFFGNANYFKERVEQLIESSEHPVKWFLWDAESTFSIDSTAAVVLESVIKDLRARNITFGIARVKGPIRHTLQSTTLGNLFQSAPHYATIRQAFKSYCEEYPKTMTLIHRQVIKHKKELKRRKQQAQ